MARYDHGLRGLHQTARRRAGRPWHLHPGSEDPRDGRRGYGPPGPRGYDGGWWPTGPRVTARYNRDYVWPEGERYPTNYNPYGGDTPWRVGDYTRYQRPYLTRGGSRTYRGGRTLGWEQDVFPAGPFRPPRGYGGDYYY